MKYRSPIKCEMLARQSNGETVPCTKGAEYNYNSKNVCISHLQKMVTGDYIAAHPECILNAEVKIGQTVYHLSPDKMARLAALLSEDK